MAAVPTASGARAIFLPHRRNALTISNSPTVTAAQITAIHSGRTVNRGTIMINASTIPTMIAAGRSRPARTRRTSSSRVACPTPVTRSPPKALTMNFSYRPGRRACTISPWNVFDSRLRTAACLSASVRRQAAPTPCAAATRPPGRHIDELPRPGPSPRAGPRPHPHRHRGRCGRWPPWRAGGRCEC